MTINLALPLFAVVPVGLCFAFGYKILKANLSPLHVLPGPKRDSLIIGNLPSLYAVSTADIGELLNDTYGPVTRTHALLGTQPGLCISDPEAANKILVVDPDEWIKPTLSNFIVTMLFGPGLSSASSASHKRQRKMLNPFFTAAHMRTLTAHFYDLSQRLSSKILTLIEAEGNGTEATLDILKLASAAALDGVGSAGLGHDFDALNTESEYEAVIKLLTPTLNKLRIFLPFVRPLSVALPYSFRMWFIDAICPWLGSLGQSVSQLRYILSVMERTSQGLYKQKLTLVENELVNQVPQTIDILSSLVRASRADANPSLTEPEALAQIKTMIYAAHETTSRLLARLFEHLAYAPDLQARLREEIEISGAADDLDYDSIMALPLLDAACREILRLYPPALFLSRHATVDTVVPLSEPIETKAGTVNELFIPKGTDVRLSIVGMNRSKALWGEDAKEFNIDRWFNAVPEKATRIPGVFSSMLTFSGGPRCCIGYRFALIEIKIIMSVLLRNFTFEPSDASGNPVKWMTGSVVFPVLKDNEDAGPQLPLKIITRL